jgi:hypothetical protein
MRMIVASSFVNFLAQIRKTESGASAILLLARSKPASQKYPPTLAALKNTEDDR